MNFLATLASIIPPLLMVTVVVCGVHGQLRGDSRFGVSWYIVVWGGIALPCYAGAAYLLWRVL